MKITKFIHSCLLIEEADKHILIDPGNYTFEAKALNINSIAKLDYLLITHEHQDHMYLPLIKEISKKFPSIIVLSNNSVKSILDKEEIGVLESSNKFIQTELILHEKVFGNTPPLNMKFVINDALTVPGDSLSFNTSTKILALPVQAPWGSLNQAVELALKLKPEVIIPIHDWHWSESARIIFYKRLENYFENMGIRFIGLQTGVEVVV